MVHSTVLRKELPILTLLTVLTVALIADLMLTRLDAIILLIVFSCLMIWTIYQGLKQKTDSMAKEVEAETAAKAMPIKRAVFWLMTGLVMLIASSRILVWGAVEIAQIFGVSDMIIGLTIVAVGTSLPELASSVIAVRKGEHDIALGNVLGSNLFNTLAVVGIAGTIHPLAVEPETLSRDMVVMGALTVSLFLIGYGFKGRQGRINRFEGMAFLTVYAGYTGWLMVSVLHR
jgi:cation:H+ antiporter